MPYFTNYRVSEFRPVGRRSRDTQIANPNVFSSPRWNMTTAATTKKRREKEHTKTRGFQGSKLHTALALLARLDSRKRCQEPTPQDTRNTRNNKKKTSHLSELRSLFSQTNQFVDARTTLPLAAPPPPRRLTFLNTDGWLLATLAPNISRKTSFPRGSRKCCPQSPIFKLFTNTEKSVKIPHRSRPLRFLFFRVLVCATLSPFSRHDVWLWASGRD